MNHCIRYLIGDQSTKKAEIRDFLRSNVPADCWASGASSSSEMTEMMMEICLVAPISPCRTCCVAVVKKDKLPVILCFKGLIAINFEEIFAIAPAAGACIANQC